MIESEWKKGGKWKIKAMMKEREMMMIRGQKGEMENHVSKNINFLHIMIDCMPYGDHDREGPGASPCVIKRPSHSRGSICSRGLCSFTT